MIATLLATAVLSTPTLPISVEGPGYLRFAWEGRIVYTKRATLTLQSGAIRTTSGAGTMPLLDAPRGTTALDAEPDGRIIALIGTERKEVGKILLAVFEGEPGFTAHGEFFVARQRPRLMAAGTDASGTLRVGTRIAQSSSGSSSIPIAQPAKTAAISLALEPKVSLTRERVFLTEIAKIDAKDPWLQRLEAIDFGPSPKPGFPLRLPRERIVARLKAIGLADADFSLSMAPVIEVHGPGQVIESAAMRDAALAALRDRFGDQPLRLQAEPALSHAPLGTVELKAEDVQIRKEQAIVTLAILVDGKRLDSRTLVFEGAALAIQIRANQMVKVVLRANGIALETTGKVRREARLGETVEVVVTVGSEPATLSGIVRPGGIVEVTL